MASPTTECSPALWRPCARSWKSDKLSDGTDAGYERDRSRTGIATRQGRRRTVLRGGRRIAGRITESASRRDIRGGRGVDARQAWGWRITSGTMRSTADRLDAGHQASFVH